MSDRRKLTKAEAGRLGGKATVKKYGPEHMRTIGKAGFRGVRRKFGFMGGSGRGALRWLNRQGKIPAAARSGPGKPDLSRTPGAAPTGRRARTSTTR